MAGPSSKASIPCHFLILWGQLTFKTFFYKIKSISLEVYEYNRNASTRYIIIKMEYNMTNINLFFLHYLLEDVAECPMHMGASLVASLVAFFIWKTKVHTLSDLCIMTLYLNNKNVK